ncbi:MAG: serine/threonine-protein kinase, partial [Cyanobacteria bacterium J06554_3]
MNAHILSGRYKVLRALASGGMGQTFVAEDTQMPGNPICVVKQLKPAADDPNFTATAKRLFFSEAETLQKLGTHDQIPRLLAYFEEDNEFYLVQDYVEGHSLDQEIALGQRWSESRVVQLLQDILGILSFVHGQNVIHRDIKPENIIRRDRDQKLVLIDFGAVKQIQLSQLHLPGNTVAIGTHGYMPPEQISGHPRMNSDLYAVGKIAIQALTGLLPTQLNQDSDGELIWRDQATTSDGLAQFLSKMVKTYHTFRYQTTDDALLALAQLTTANPGHSSDPSPAAVASVPVPISTPPHINSKTFVPTASTAAATNTTAGTVVVSPSTPEQAPPNGIPNTVNKRINPLLLVSGLLILALVSGIGSFSYFSSRNPSPSNSTAQGDPTGEPTNSEPTTPEPVEPVEPSEPPSEPSSDPSEPVEPPEPPEPIDPPDEPDP